MDYDQVADDYATHRQLHAGVFQELCRRARPRPGSRVLEVGCGTGNYVRALATGTGCVACGLDPSSGMLARGRHHGPRRSVDMEPLHWLQGQGEPLAFANSSFDLIFSVDVIHHLHDVPGFYREVSRTLRPDGLLCTVTDSADIIHQREVLSGYFPGTVAIELARYPRVSQLEEWMERAGLRDLATVTVEDRYEITNAQPFRDRAFSSLHLIPEDAWRAGLDRLEHDLARGPISGASRYVCVWGRMPRELASGRWR